MRFLMVMTGIALLLAPATLKAEEVPRTPSAEGAVAYIISPAHGEVVGRKVTIKFGLQGMGVAPAGVKKKNTGHHHLLIDGRAGLPSLSQPMGKKGIKHFGGGQTDTVLELSPGQHTLQLILGDQSHIPHDPPVISGKILIVVK